MVSKQQINLKTDELLSRYNTRDPYLIAEEKGIIIITEDLGDIFGYYHKISRIPFIHINERLSYQDQVFTCFHELGHAIFHPNENTPKLSTVSLCSEIRIEAEANYFATRFLIDGSHHDYCIQTKQELLQHYGIPKQMERFI
ncbi:MULTISPECIES: ImmA/IrrE family metallo-endopeptidase [Bacillus cereus group]|uniref:ImmA/IrrE family metallo-endopeptidase n=1 Tax=Bacillus proteolyticus TaxID=2026192 RepID=A0ABV3I8V6_9BACI|nr:ImmA/IrrE family metallo-endopeptidase [Bacillus cereus group sp. N8]MBJ8103622.1 ImmA/IrrE family metallo-endopeptidase [Bacillus cereus group sp. N8]